MKIFIMGAIFMVGLMVFFLNCSGFNASRFGDESFSSQASQIENLDWSFAESLGPKLDIKDLRGSRRIGFFGNDKVLVHLDHRLILSSLNPKEDKEILKLERGSVEDVFSFPSLNKIFFVEVDLITRKSYLNVLGLGDLRRKKILEVYNSNACGAYIAEPRILKVLCGVAHSSQAKQMSPVLIDANTESVIRLKEPVDINIENNWSSNLHDLEFQTKTMDPFIFPKSNQIIVETWDPSTSTSKLIKFSETSIEPVTSATKDDYWGTGEILSLAEAKGRVADYQWNFNDTSCLGVDYSEVDFGMNTSDLICTPSGLFVSGYDPKTMIKQNSFCTAIGNCMDVPISLQGLLVNEASSIYVSPDRSKVLLWNSIVSHVNVYAVFDSSSKTLTPLLTGISSENTPVVRWQERDPSLYLILSPDFYMTDHGPDRAMVVYDSKDGRFHPLPMTKVSNIRSDSLDLWRTNSGFVVAVEPDNGEAEGPVFLMPGPRSAAIPAGYSIWWQTYEAENSRQKRILLTKTEETNPTMLYEMDMESLAPRPVGPFPAVAGHIIQGQFVNRSAMIQIMKLPSSSGNQCRIEIFDREKQATVIQRDYVSSFCTFFKSLEGAGFLLFVLWEDPSKPLAMKYDYATNEIEELGEIDPKSSLAYGEISINQKYFFLGDLLVDSKGTKVSRYPGASFKSSPHDAALNPLLTKIYAKGSKTNPVTFEVEFFQYEIDPMNKSAQEFSSAGKGYLWNDDSRFLVETEETPEGYQVSSRSGGSYSFNSRYVTKRGSGLFGLEFTNGLWRVLNTDLGNPNDGLQVIYASPQIEKARWFISTCPACL